MAEKRKPTITILLKIEGKTKSTKLELFDQRLWGDGSFGGAKRYRIRLNGAWFDKKKGFVGNKYFTKWTFRDLFFRSLKI